MAGAHGLAFQAPAVAKEQRKSVGFTDRLLEGKRGARGVIDGGAGFCEFGGHEVHLIVQESRLHGAGAVEAPIGNGHFANDDVLGGGDRLEFVDQGMVKGEKCFAILVAEDGREGSAFGRGEAVGDAGVGGRAGLAFGRDGPGGLQRIGAVGGELAFRRHLGNESTTRVWARLGGLGCKVLEMRGK